MSNIATYLKCLMEATNITITQLARRSGVAKATISRLLKGETRSSLHAIDKLLAVFGCHLTVRRKPNTNDDFEPGTGKRKLPYDDPLENNPKLAAILNEKQKTPRP